VPVMPVVASLRSGWPKNAAEAWASARRAVLDLEHRQTGLEDQQVVEFLRRVGNNGQRASGDGFLHVAVAVVEPPFMATKPHPVALCASRTRRL